MPRYICFVCEKEVKDTDDFEWFGLDGEKIHKKCELNVERKMSYIDNMSDEQFYNYMTKN